MATIYRITDYPGTNPVTQYFHERSEEIPGTVESRE
jgi:hypothetical protein